MSSNTVVRVGSRLVIAGVLLTGALPATSTAQQRASYVLAQNTRLIPISELVTGRREAPPAAAALRERVNVTFDHTPLSDALTSLAGRVGLGLSYRDDIGSPRVPVTARLENLPAADAFAEVLHGTGYNLLVSETGVLVVVRVPAASPAKRRQQAASVTGRVVDSTGQTPLADATVVLEGTELGARTGVDGRYRIANVPPGTHTLRARRIGYATGTRQISVAAGEMTTADFALRPSATELGAVVVTGTAGESQRVQQPAVVGTIDAASIVQRAPVSDVTQLLQAREPGVVVSTSSGTSGTASRINIRGAASVSLSNQPLVFIDGVRMESRPRNLITAYSNEGVGGQNVSAINDINPEEIERIEVVKGPAAATLYGADASAGVIQIITKKGATGSRRFTQTLTTEWNDIDPQFDPGSTYQVCGAFTGAVPACPGSSAADSARIVSVNVIKRDDIFRHGHLGSMQYSGTGGGDNFGYYVAGGIDKEIGTLRNTGVDRRSGRVNFNWLPNAKSRVDATFGVAQNINRIPQSDDAIYGYTAGAYLGDPRTAGVPEFGNGWLLPNWGAEAGANIDNRVTTLRTTPSLQGSYSPWSWFTNRLIVGADYARAAARAFFPLNAFGWYAATSETANGEIEETRDNITTYTVDYLGSVKTSFGDGRYASDLAFGTQYINERDDRVRATGQGLTTNAADVVSAAANISASQFASQTKSFGYFAQEQLGIADRLFLQVGARVDQNSSFGTKAPSFFLPKAGFSYVLSQERFWKGLSSAIPTLRLRAAYGTTGRAPSPGASLTTYAPAPFILNGELTPGVLPLNAGNPDLKAERGKEFEGGFDAGFFNDRAGLELTYYNKVTSDLLLRQQLPPSLGFTQNPYINIGKVDNRGFEFALRSTLIDMPAFTWDARFSGSTLRNRLVSLGGLAPFSGGGGLQRFTPGRSLGAYFTYRVRRIDTANGVAVVSNEPEFVGNSLPTFQGSLSSTMTLFKFLQVYGLLDTKRGYRLFDITNDFRDRFFSNTKGVVLPASQGGFSDEERLRRLGPYVTENGDALGGTFRVMDEPYLPKGDYVRFRELSATISLPNTLTRSLGTTGTSLTLGVRNLALWTDFPGDPEVLSSGPGAPDSPNFSEFANTNEFAVPQPRRWVAKLNLQF